MFSFVLLYHYAIDHTMPPKGNTTIAPIMGISRHRLLTDGRGVTTLVGMYGCPLNCAYCLNNQCHKPDGIWQHLSPQELYAKVCIDDIYYRSTGGGITFGGGEPALHSQFIKEFALLNKQGWHITLETSLNVPTLHIERLLDVVDEYIIDIKTLNPTTYKVYTGQSIEPVLENLRYLIERNKGTHITLRIPLIPGYNTAEEVTKTQNELQKMGITHFDTFTYITNTAHRAQSNGKSGKSTCNVLKKIRTIIAEANNIPYTPALCTHTVCTMGNCPMCEKELAWLTQQINLKNAPIL